MSLDLKQTQNIAQDIALQAADRLLEFFGGTFHQESKASPYDMVTEADRASEEIIVAELLSHFPDHHIVGEEGGGMGKPVEAAEYRWYVDPLDGTTNFANGIPQFVVSMALTDADLNPLVGVVYQPIAKEMFTAIRGEGAWLNGRRIHVGSKQTLAQSVVCSGFPYDKYTNPDNNIAEWSAFVTRTRGVRRFGAAAGDLCYVAAGRFDAYWESNLNPWDVLAGALIAREAGAVVTDYTGNSENEIFLRKRLVVCNPALHPQMLEVIALARAALDG